MNMISFEQLTSKDDAIAVVGLGYVGLPLAVALGRHFRVVGVDVSEQRVAELKQRVDRTNEVDFSTVGDDVDLTFSADLADLATARLILVAVPTPIDEFRTPDLRPVKGASASVGKYLQPGSVVVYESTVYPGLTEDICVPILEAESGLTCGSDFWVGYSPERINPGDQVHRLETIVKVVAGQNEEAGRLLQDVYGTVVKAGTHLAPDIRTAEAAKVIENTQRDLNIALMNELSLIFDTMGIDTLDVLEAAGTKWNFLPFRPGLVGGHCIGVDPYYLTFKAEAMGFHPHVILAGREINDNNGQVYCRVHDQAAYQARLQDQGCASGRARSDLQGECARSAQHAGGRHSRGAGRLWRGRAGCMTPRPTMKRRVGNWESICALLTICEIWMR